MFYDAVGVMHGRRLSWIGHSLASGTRLGANGASVTARQGVFLYFTCMGFRVVRGIYEGWLARRGILLWVGEIGVAGAWVCVNDAFGMGRTINSGSKMLF